MAKINKADELQKAIETVLSILLDSKERKDLAKCAKEHNTSIESVALASLLTGGQIALLGDKNPDGRYLERFKGFLSRIEFNYTFPPTKNCSPKTNIQEVQI